MIKYGILAVSILFGATGQIFLKHASSQTSKLWLISPFFNIYLLIALVIYFASVLLYTFSLRDIPLHIAFPSVSFSYVLVAYLSSRIWDTPFGVREIIAFALIMLAIFLLASSQKTI